MTIDISALDAAKFDRDEIKYLSIRFPLKTDIPFILWNTSMLTQVNIRDCIQNWLDIFFERRKECLTKKNSTTWIYR